MKEKIRLGGGYLLIIIILLVVTNGITYGVTSLQSDSVSYMKHDGKLTTVKKALDELITKSSKVDALEMQVSDYEKQVRYLADVAKVGEYVAYDAGDWTDVSKIPTDQGEFGGYTQGQSKNDSVATCESLFGTTNLKGWRVLSKDEKTKTVTIIHAGQPECYFHKIEYSEESVKKLNERAASKYLNPIYAVSARAMSYEELKIIQEDTDLRIIGTNYWLASNDNSRNLYTVDIDGSLSRSASSHARGYRPVVELKAKILTTGEGQNEFGQKAWELVKMK